MIINLKLNDIEVGLQESETIGQTFYPIGEGSTLRRLSNGDAVKMTKWSNKFRIETRGTGRLPLPILGLDYAAPLVMQCCTPISQYSGSNVIAMPPGFTHNAVNYKSYRSDVSLIGNATVNGRLVHAQIVSNISDVVTLTSITGATGYQITYWPIFLVFANKPSESQEIRGGDRRQWDMTAETV